MCPGQHHTIRCSIVPGNNFHPCSCDCQVLLGANYEWLACELCILRAANCHQLNTTDVGGCSDSFIHYSPLPRQPATALHWPILVVPKTNSLCNHPVHDTRQPTQTPFSAASHNHAFNHHPTA